MWAMDQSRAAPSAMVVCPSCHSRYDDLHHRVLKDQCGHERCSACMIKRDVCPVCEASECLVYSTPLEVIPFKDNSNLENWLGRLNSSIKSFLKQPCVFW